MNRTIPTALTLLALLGAGEIAGAQPSAGVVGVRDRAGMFSAEAVREADDALREVRRKTHWSAAIETVDSLDGKTIKDLAVENARVHKVHGLYILLAKKEHKFYAEPSHLAERVFTRDKIKDLDDTIVRAFKAGKFDQGLHDAVALIRREAESAPDTTSAASAPVQTGPGAPSAPVRPTASAPPSPPVHDSQQGSVLPMLLIGGGAVILVLWLLSRAFRGAPTASSPPQSFNQAGPGPQPGYAPQPQAGYRPPPQPGYGPAAQPGYAPPPQPGFGYAPPPPQQGGGGGGFLSGVLGGAAGAVAGNILYDKFGHPHEAPGIPPHNPAGAVPPQETPWPGAGAGAGAGAETSAPPAESYDPNAGGGGDWGTPEPAAESESDPGGGGDWGTPEPAAESESDPGAGGDWGSADPDPAPDTGGGGDWGSADPAPDDNQGGSW